MHRFVNGVQRSMGTTRQDAMARNRGMDAVPEQILIRPRAKRIGLGVKSNAWIHDVHQSHGCGIDNHFLKNGEYIKPHDLHPWR